MPVCGLIIPKIRNKIKFLGSHTPHVGLSKWNLAWKADPHGIFHSDRCINLTEFRILYCSVPCPHSFNNQREILHARVNHFTLISTLNINFDSVFKFNILRSRMWVHNSEPSSVQSHQKIFLFKFWRLNCDTTLNFGGHQPYLWNG